LKYLLQLHPTLLAAQALLALVQTRAQLSKLFLAVETVVVHEVEGQVEWVEVVAIKAVQGD